MNEVNQVNTFPTPLSSLSILSTSPTGQNVKLQRLGKTRFSLGDGTSLEDDDEEVKTESTSSLPELSIDSAHQNINFYYKFSTTPTCWESLTARKRVLMAFLMCILPLIICLVLDDDMNTPQSSLYFSHFSIFSPTLLAWGVSTLIMSCLLPCSSFAAIFGFITYSWLKRPWSDGAVCSLLWIFLFADFSSQGGSLILYSAGLTIGVIGVFYPSVFRHVGRVDLVFLVFVLVRPSSTSVLIFLPRFMRSYCGISCCMLGFLAARCVVSFPSEFHDVSLHSLLTTAASRSSQKNKRRKSSPLTQQGQMDAQMVKRRISLPSLYSRGSSTSICLDSTLLREAQGILADMMLDPQLPTHLFSGLKAVNNIFKLELHTGQGTGGVRRSRGQGGLLPSSPGLPPPPDAEEWPESDRSPTTSKMKQRRSLVPSVVRCRSATSSWTTTTSATGLPILEPHPSHGRSAIRSSYPSSSPSSSAATLPSKNVDGNVGRVGSLSSRSGSIQVSNRFALGAYLPRRSVHVMMTSDYESSDSPSSCGEQQHGGETLKNDFDLRNSRRQVTQKKLDKLSKWTIKSDEKDDNKRKHQKSVEFAENVQFSMTTSYDEEFTGDQQSADVLETCEQQIDDKLHRELEEEKNEETDDDDDDDERKFDYFNDEVQCGSLLERDLLSRWDYPIFHLSDKAPETILSRVAYKIFSECGFMDTYSIPLKAFFSFFHSLESGYHNNFYHNRIHATDVLHAVYYMTTQPIPGFTQINNVQQQHARSKNTKDVSNEQRCAATQQFPASSTCSNHDNHYGVMATNFPTLELMALYTAAAMHDFDHPGRTNAFLVSTSSPVAILYNDRSVLENHHVASAWSMLTSDPSHHWLINLDSAELKRFRFLVIEAVLATDLKRHFEIVAEFNSKVNDVDSSNFDWTQEGDRLMVANMVIKMADINGPCKPNILHLAWTDRICREFYDQGDEEKNLGVAVSPFMDRQNPQLSKLQESFINHLVSPLCHALSDAGLLPGVYSEENSAESSQDTSSDEESDKEDSTDLPVRHVSTPLMENLKDNIKMWLKHIEDDTIPQSLSIVTIPISQEVVNSVTLKIIAGDSPGTACLLQPEASECTSAPHCSTATPTPPPTTTKDDIIRKTPPPPFPSSSLQSSSTTFSPQSSSSSSSFHPLPTNEQQDCFSCKMSSKEAHQFDTQSSNTNFITTFTTPSLPPSSPESSSSPLNEECVHLHSHSTASSLISTTSLASISHCCPTKVKPVHLQPLKFTISKSHPSRSALQQKTDQPELDSSVLTSTVENISSKLPISSNAVFQPIFPSSTTTSPPIFFNEVAEKEFTFLGHETIRKFSSTENLSQVVTKKNPPQMKCSYSAL